MAFSGALRSPFGGGMRVTMASSTSAMPMPDLADGEDRVVGREADDFLDLGLDLVDLCGGQVDLVDDGDDFMVVLDRLVDIGEGLGLDPLRGVDHEQRAFACGKRCG